MSKGKVVIALGGNAIQSGEATAKAQQMALEETVDQLIGIIEEGFEIIVTHGNGPQVGNIVLQQKAADSEKTPAMPLDTCGAMSQGMIGYWMENAFTKAFSDKNIDKDVVSIVTRTIVDQNDPAFRNPTKPIGPFYSDEEARRLMEEQDLIFKEDSGRGWRRVVASPKPVGIKEHKMIKHVVDSGALVIAVGGGGIPVVEDEHGIHGVEAVIDKDFASQKLAELIDADTLIVLTAVDHVCVHFNTPDQKQLTNVTVTELEQYIEEKHFAPGSMLPKVEAAINFVKSKPGRKAIITSLENAKKALLEGYGTHISQ